MAHITINLDSTSNGAGRSITIDIGTEEVRRAIVAELEERLREWHKEFNALINDRGLTPEAALAIMQCCPSREVRYDGHGKRKWRWSR